MCAPFDVSLSCRHHHRHTTGGFLIKLNWLLWKLIFSSSPTAFSGFFSLSPGSLLFMCSLSLGLGAGWRYFAASDVVVVAGKWSNFIARLLFIFPLRYLWWLCRVCGGLLFHISRSCMKHLQLLLLFFFFFFLLTFFLLSAPIRFKTLYSALLVVVVVVVIWELMEIIFLFIPKS